MAKGVQRAVKSPAIQPTPLPSPTESNLIARLSNMTTLLQQVPALIAILHGTDGQVELYNDEFRKLWGERDILGAPARKAWPELSAIEWQKIIAKVMTSAQTVSCSEVAAAVRGSAASGQRHWFNFIFYPYKNETGETVGVMLYGTDITAHILARNLAEKSEERYHAFIQNSSEGIWRFEIDEPIPITAPQQQQIDQIFDAAYLAEANEAMAKMYGLDSSDDIIGSRLTDLMVRDDPRNIEYLKAFIESGYNLSNVESHEIDANGQDKFFSNSLVGIVENGHLIRAWGSQLDITEQHQAAEAMHENQERLNLAISSSKMGMWEYDVTSGKLLWSDQLKRLYGLSDDAVITYEKYMAMVHPDDRRKSQAIIDYSMKTGKSYRVEHRIIWPDGSEHWLLGQGKTFLKDGTPVRMIGTSINIDQIKAVHLRTQESEARFRSMADNAPVIIWVTDKDGNCTYLNKLWADFTGLPADKDLTAGWTEVVHPDDKQRLNTTYSSAAIARKPYNIEYRIRRHDGAYRYVIENGTPRFSAGNDFMGFIGSCMDIDDLKHHQDLETLNKNLRKQRAQLVALNNAKDEFIAIASHQLRTPATGVKQYVGMVMEGYAGDITETQRSMLQAAFDSNERQIRVVDDLLRVARVDAGKIRPVKIPTDLAKLLQDIIAGLKSKIAARKQNINLSLKSDIPNITVDENLVRMVIENVIDNACKYSYEGKPVNVELKKTGQYITIKVRDKGIGISKEDQKKLFKKFSRVDNPLSLGVDGTGLGLYWALKIINLHGGSIGVTSAMNKGSTFTIKLPLG